MTTITLLNKNNEPSGPFTREQVAEKLQSGEFNLESLAFIEGLSQWTPLRLVLAKVDAVAPLVTPPVQPAPASAVTAPAAQAYSYAATMEPPPHLEYAGFWIRVVARLLDNMIVSIPIVVLYIVVVAVFIGVAASSGLGKDQSSDSKSAVSAAIVGTAILLYVALFTGVIVIVWLYHAILESGPHQSTWGKRILRLKVTNITGERITFAHASGRYFGTMLTNMTMGIGYLMVAFTDRKQSLHDMIAGTLVVKH